MTQNIKHSQLVNDIRLTCSDQDTRIFLNSTGNAYPIGTIQGILEIAERQVPGFHRIMKSMLQGKIISYGLAVGGSDLIAIHKTTIIPEMIGEEVGIFCGIEVKTEDDTVKPEQVDFSDTINRMGGNVGVARGPNHINQAIEIIHRKDFI